MRLHALFTRYKSPKSALIAKKLVEEDKNFLTFCEPSPSFDAVEGPYLIDSATALLDQKSGLNKHKNANLREIWSSLGNMSFMIGPEAIENYNKIIAFYTPYAAEGNMTAKFTLATIHRILRNFSEAQGLLKEAAEGELPEAQFCLGAFLAETEKEENLQEALIWRTKAAVHKIEGVYVDIGCQYMDGIGTHKDIEEARRNFKKATKTDQDGLAEFQLYFLHEENEPLKSRFFLEQAAKKKCTKAQYRLGLIYEREGLENNDLLLKDDLLLKACALYRQSAKQGFRKAQYKYACCCRDGTGTRQNTERAKKWLKNPAEKGYGKAKKALNKLNKLETIRE